MVNLKTIVQRTKNTTLSVEKICKIKKYISIKDKIKIIDELDSLVESHINDFPQYESLVAFVFFNLIVVKKYTDIDIEFTYEEFDTLQESGLLNKIIEYIGEDYSLLLRLVQMNSKSDKNETVD